MREDLPPFARFVFGVASFVMAATGLVMWMFSWAGVFGMGVMLATEVKLTNSKDLLVWILILVGGLVFQAIGSAMYFFSQTLVEHKPQSVPTELLPRWWLARFMVPLCFEVSIVGFLGVVWCLFRLDPIGIPWAIGLWAGDRGFRHFRRKIVELSPPYPPRSGPPKWETRG